MSSLRSDVIQALVETFRSEGAGAKVDRELIAESGAEWESIVISINPLASGPASMRVHVDGDSEVDILVGEGIRIEYPLGMEGRAVVLEELRTIARSVIHGRVKEKVRRRAGEVGLSKGQIQTEHGMIRTSGRSLSAGWLFGHDEVIHYTKYPPGELIIEDGTT